VIHFVKQGTLHFIMFSDVREDAEVGASVPTDTGRSPRAVPA